MTERPGSTTAVGRRLLAAAIALVAGVTAVIVAIDVVRGVLG